MSKPTQINIVLPEPLVQALDEAAEKHRFSRSELARLILAERLAGTVYLVTDHEAAKKLAAMRRPGRPKTT
jgi:metal-responsive CopG/Arc/MetJ family transcriptional regulator